MNADVRQRPEPVVIDLFLCHNNADKDWVRALGAQIEAETFEGTPEGRPLRVFFDEWDVNVAENLLLALNRGLTTARYVGIILSPEMLAAPWPALEWTHAVANDPTNRRGRIIPLLVRDGTEKGGPGIELPAPFRVLNWIDFRKREQFNRSYLRLIRYIRNLPPERGPKRRPLAMTAAPATPLVAAIPEISAEPDRVDEVILGNLLPVESFPTTIWGAPTECRKGHEVIEKVGECPSFTLKRGMLYTFHDLSGETVFASAIQKSGITSVRAQDWREHPDRSRWLISLLNWCLGKHLLRNVGIRPDDKGRYYFTPLDGQTRRIQHPGDPPREVAAKKKNSAGDEFWVHHGAWLGFKVLGESLYLLVEPCYVFTSDGITPLASKTVGPLSMKWTGKERNAAILRHLVFWARSMGLGRNKICIETGGASIIVSGIPALARCSRGVHYDHIRVGSLLHQIDNELDDAAEAVRLVTQLTEDEFDEEEDIPSAK